MKLQLAYNNELELPSLNSYQERLDYVLENLFESEEEILSDEFDEIMSYKQFYNHFSLEYRTEEHLEQIRGRWIGVKRVGSAHPDEHTKNTIDFVTTYTLLAGDLSVRRDVHEFKKLKRKEVNQRADRVFTKEEEQELRELEQNVIHFNLVPNNHDEDLAFFYNKNFEDRLKSRLLGIEDKAESTRLKNKLGICRKLRANATLKTREIKKIKDKINNIKERVNKNYILLNEDVYNEELISLITNDIRYIRLLERNIYYTEVEIADLADSYKQETELIISKEI